MVDMYLTMLFFSLLLVAAVWIARVRWGPGGAFWASLIGGGFLFLCGPLPAVVQAFATILIALICWPLRAKSWVVVVLAVGAMVLGHAWWIGTSVQKWNEIARLQKEFPFVSLAERLEFEERGTSTSPEPVFDGLLSEPVEARLDAFESEQGWGSRSYHLSRLHQQTSLQFVMASDFGVKRMLRFRPAALDLPLVDPVTLPPPPYVGEPYSPNDEQAVPLAVDEAEAQRLFGVHRTVLDDVFDPERIGYVRDRDHVAGFLPHRMREVPGPAEEYDWRVTRLELIGLLRHEEPVVYVSRELPRMDELGEAPTRPVDVFEHLALQRLRRYEDLVVDASPDVIRMVGSIRAAKDCLACHSVQRGELLGAFSYDLHGSRRTSR